MKYKWYFIYTFFWKYKRSILYLYFFFLRSTCKVYLISVRDPRWEVTQLLTVQHRLDSGQVIHGRLHIFTAYSLLIEVFYIIFIKNLKPCFMPGNWKKKNWLNHFPEFSLESFYYEKSYWFYWNGGTCLSALKWNILRWLRH